MQTLGGSKSKKCCKFPEKPMERIPLQGSWFCFLYAGICCICWMQDRRLQMRLYFSMQLFDKWLSSNSEPILTFENMANALMLYGEGMFIIKLFTSLNFRVSQLPNLHLGHWGK